MPCMSRGMPNATKPVGATIAARGGKAKKAKCYLSRPERRIKDLMFTCIVPLKRERQREIREARYRWVIQRAALIAQLVRAFG